MDARGTTPPRGPQGEPSPWPHHAAQPPASPAYGPPQPPSSPAYGIPPAPQPQPHQPNQPQQPQRDGPQQPHRQHAQPPHQPHSTGQHPQPRPSAAPPQRRAPDGRTTLARVLRAWWAGRLRRLVPRGVPWTAVVFAAVLLAAWVLFADILITPGVVMPFPGETPSRDWGHDVVGWFALQITFGLGFASAVMLLQLGRPWWRWASVALAVASTAVTLGMVTSGPGQGLGWIVGVAAAGLLAASFAVLAALLPAPRAHLAVGAALALAIQWGLVTWVGMIEPTQWVFLMAWTNLAFPVLVVIGAVAILAVAVYAQQVHARADRIGRRILLASWVPIVAAGAALVVVLLRMGPFSMLFGELDANLWGIGTPASWPHAIVSGALIVWLVARSGTAPLRSRGHVLVIVVLATVAGMAFVSFMVAYLILTFVEVVPEEWAPVSEALASLGNPAGLLVATLLLVPVLLPQFRRSTGRAGAITALVVAVPLQVWLILSLDLGLPVERFAASPSQVAFVILVAVLALAIWGAIRRRDVVDRHLLLRLALVPVLTMHAGQLLPGVWKDDFEQALVVVLSLAGLLLLGAPRTGTKEGNARAIVVPFAVQMAVLGSVIVSRTMGQLMDDESTTISVLYLTLPVATVLCCRLEDASDAWRGQATSTIDLQTMRRAQQRQPVVAHAGQAVQRGGGWGGQEWQQPPAQPPGQGWQQQPTQPPGQGWQQPPNRQRPHPTDQPPPQPPR